MNDQLNLINKKMAILFFGALMLAACSGNVFNINPTATPAPSPINTIAPTATPIPFIALFSSGASNSELLMSAQDELEALAAEKGWRIENFPPADSMSKDLLRRRPQLIAGIGSGMGLTFEKEAAENTDVRFLLVEDSEVKFAVNLLAINGSAFRKEEAGFMAGLLAGMENTNRLVGWVGESGTLSGRLYRNGFQHGVHFFCPVCVLYEYEAALGAPAAEGKALADSLMKHYVDTASAVPGAAGDAALAELSNRNVRVAGTYPGFKASVFGGLSGAGVDNVLGEPALIFRPVLHDMLTRYMQGEKFNEPTYFSIENGGLIFAPFPNKWITPGKQSLIQEVILNIKNGKLAVGVDQKTGEAQ
jgi:basic membrane lipoprotein Med (substrate-binding protein (PBP1-ABC) superfamily)